MTEREFLSNILESEDEEIHKRFVRFLQAQKDAIEAHKWIESEKVGHDLGVRYVNKTTSQITSVGSLHSGISQTLTSTVSRDKVLKH